MNIADRILFQARQNPPAAAICAPGTAINLISYARLARFMNNAGRRALASGLRPGNIAAIMIKDYILHVVIALALARIGVATFSVTNLRFPPGLRVDALITDMAGLTGNPPNAPVLPADLTWTEGDGNPIEGRFLSNGGDELARIVLTSGSTGTPKAIPISHQLELRRMENLFYAFPTPFAECSRFFSDMGLGSGTCFRLLLYVLSRGGTFFFPGATPMDSLQTFNLYGVHGLLASPGGLSGIVKFYEANSAFRSSFNVIISAGSPLHRSLSERVRARLTPNLIFFYGTSETATVASAPAHVVADIPGGVGYVMPGVNVDIVDSEQRVLPPRARSGFAVPTPSPDISVIRSRRTCLFATATFSQAISACSRMASWSCPGARTKCSTWAAIR